MRYFHLTLYFLALIPLFGGGESSGTPSLGAMHTFPGSPSTASALPLDEALLSRQLLVYGRHAQSLLGQAHVAVVAAKHSHTLLEEVCRQMVMVGVGRLTIVAEEVDSVAPLVGQLEEHSSATIIRSSTTVRAIGSNVDAVVAADLPLVEAVEINKLCRELNIKMIGCRASGATGYVFCDLIDHTILSRTSHESNGPVPLLSITPLRLEQDNIGTQYALSKQFELIRLVSIDDERLPVGVNDSCIIRSGEVNVTATVASAVSSKECLVRVSGKDCDKLSKLRESFSENGGSVQRQVLAVKITHVPLLQLLKNPKFESLNGCLTPDDATDRSICLLAAYIAHDKVLALPTRVHTSSSLTEQKKQFVASAADTARFLISDSQYHAPSSVQFNSPYLGKVLSLVQDKINKIKLHCTLRLRWGLWRRKEAQIFDSFFHESHVPELALAGEQRGRRGLSRENDHFSNISLPTSSVIGGLVGQEVVKALTHSDVPVSQLLMFETFSSVSKMKLSNRFFNVLSTSPTAVQYGGSAPKRGKTRTLVVGAGAIGCEVLKNLVGSVGGSSDSAEPGSIVYVADMDVIEKSNLNRQLLFRSNDIGKSKALIAAARMNEKNNESMCRVVPIMGKVDDVRNGGDEIFRDKFWGSLDLVISAVDNVETRLFLDEQCRRHGLGMVDAGTQGMLGSTQVILPGCTEMYSDSVDPETDAIPVCTIKSFPYKAGHCVAWAKEQLNTVAVNEVDLVNQLLSNVLLSPHECMQPLVGKSDSELNYLLDWLNALLALRALAHPVADHPAEQNVSDTNLDCPDSIIPSIISEIGHSEKLLQTAIFLEYAFKLFFRFFEMDVLDLLEQHPVGSFDEDGKTPFWSGARHRPPSVETWPAFVNGYKMSCLREFVVHACILKARVSGIELDYVRVSDMLDQFENLNVVESIRASVFDHPMSPGEATSASEYENMTVRAKIAMRISNLTQDVEPNSMTKFTPLVFDKDVDDGQIDFIASAASIRCHSYCIAPNENEVKHSSYPSVLDSHSSKEANSTTLDHLYVRSVAGNIIPAVLSTTTVCASLACIEALRVLSLNSGSPDEVKDSVHGANAAFPVRAVARFLRSGNGLPSFREQHPIRSVVGVPRSENGPRASLDRHFRSSFVNLADSSPLSFATPMGPVMHAVSTTAEEFTAWDFVESPVLGLRDIISFIESRFEVRVKMLLNGDEMLYSEGSERVHAASQPLEELHIKIDRRGLAKVGVAAAPSRVPNINLILRLIERHSGREFFDLSCYCVDFKGDDVDIPKIRLVSSY